MVDPDCATLVSLPNQATERRYYEFHRDVLLAIGGMLLSGDPLPEMTLAQRTLSRLFVRHKHNQDAAQFTSLSLHHAYLPMTEQNELRTYLTFTNQHEKSLDVALSGVLV